MVAGGVGFEPLTQWRCLSQLLFFGIMARVDAVILQLGLETRAISMVIYVVHITSSVIVLDLRGRGDLRWRKLGQKMVPRCGRNS